MDRTAKILRRVDEALGIRPDVASKLTDFLLPTPPADTAALSDDALFVGLRSALMALRRLVARPRLVPWPGTVLAPFPVLCADAFFLT